MGYLWDAFSSIIPLMGVKKETSLLYPGITDKVRMFC